MNSTTPTARPLILYIAMSLDGYIAQPNEDLGFLSIVEKEGEDYGYVELISKVDTVIMGRKTYEWVMRKVPEFPHADKQTYILTRTPRPAVGNIQFYTGSLPDLVQQLKASEGNSIFCDGGAEIVNELLRHTLIDEIILSVIPILVGDGTRLFHDNRPSQQLKLVQAKTYSTGLVQLHYIRPLEETKQPE